MTTVICSEPVTIDLELSGATLQVQTDSLVVYTVEWRRWWQVWRPRCQSPGLPALHLHLRRRGEVPARSGLFLGLGEQGPHVLAAPCGAGRETVILGRPVGS